MAGSQRYFYDLLSILIWISIPKWRLPTRSWRYILRWSMTEMDLQICLKTGGPLSKKPDFADVHGEESNALSKRKPSKPLDFTGFASHWNSGAGGGTRTHTPLRITDFESVSSANSDTPAFIFLSLTPDGASRKSGGPSWGDIKKSLTY